MAEEITVVESEKIEAEDDDKKSNPIVNQVESEKITVDQVDPEKIEAEDDDDDRKANPIVNQVESEKITDNLVEHEKIEVEDKKANPIVNQVESEKITVNQAEPEEITVNQVEHEKIESEDDDKKANPIVNQVESEEITVNQVEPEKIEAEDDDDKKANPFVNQVDSEEITANEVEPEKIEAEDDDDKKANPFVNQVDSEEITANQVEPEKIEAEDDDKKANPNEIITITKGPPKILSRYLCERRSSCHDACKYGIQHATEAKPWSTSQKRRERKTNVSGEIVTSLEGTKKSGREIVTSSEGTKKSGREIVTSLEGTKKSGRSSNASPLASKLGDPNYIVDIKEVTNEKTPVSMEHNNSDIVQASSEPYSLHVKERSKSLTKGDLVKNKCAFGSSSIKETASRSKQKITSSSGGKDKSLSSSILLSSKNNIKKPSSLSDNAKNLKRVSSQKNHENGEKVKRKLANNGNLPDKIVHVIEPNSENSSEEPTLACDATKPPSPSPSKDKTKPRSPSQSKDKTKPPSPTPSKDKILKRISKKTGKSEMSASSRKGLKHVGHGTVSGTLSHQSSANRFKTNIQHKARTVSRLSSVLSFVSSSNSSIRKQNGTTSNSSIRKQNGTTFRPNKTGRKQGENVRVGYKIRPKMTTIVGAANKVIPARKLTFRRGKVIEIQPQSNNIPRRLKFRPVRLLGDDIRKDANGTRKRIISDKEVDGDELNAANIKTEKVDLKHQTLERGKNRSFGRKVGGLDRTKVYGSKSGSEKVVLRHQNVEGKKQNPGLYNNVIEETASKLAELRKSKVKALVGAFETVISLDSPREATHSQMSTVC